MFDGEAVLPSLCTFGSSFMDGSCSLSGVVVLSRCLSDGVSMSLSKRVFSFRSNLLDLVIVFCRLKLSMRLYVVVSVKCREYLSVNHEMGTSAYPMFCQYYVGASIDVMYVVGL